MNQRSQFCGKRLVLRSLRCLLFQSIAEFGLKVRRETVYLTDLGPQPAAMITNPFVPRRSSDARECNGGVILIDRREDPVPKVVNDKPLSRALRTLGLTPQRLGLPVASWPINGLRLMALLPSFPCLLRFQG